MENKFHQTLGHIPNSSGEVFGKEVYTDEYGFRQMNIPATYDESWLFLGDSVILGVGIDTEQIFPQLIQNKFQHIEIWNTAVVGYWCTASAFNIGVRFKKTESRIISGCPKGFTNHGDNGGSSPVTSAQSVALLSLRRPRSIRTMLTSRQGASMTRRSSNPRTRTGLRRRFLGATSVTTLPASRGVPSSTSSNGRVERMCSTSRYLPSPALGE